MAAPTDAERQALAPLTWVVVFHGGVAPAWWQRFLRPGFRHCLSSAYDSLSGVWTLIDWHWNGIDAMSYTASEAGSLVEWIRRHDAHCLLWRVPQDFGRPKLWWLPSCVSSVMLWLRVPGYCLTPYQLYRRMLDLGAVPILEAEADGLWIDTEDHLGAAGVAGGAVARARATEGGPGS